MLNEIRAEIRALRKERDKAPYKSDLYFYYQEEMDKMHDKLFIMLSAGDVNAFKGVSQATLERWLTLDLPADVLAEIEQELNTRKD